MLEDREYYRIEKNKLYEKFNSNPEEGLSSREIERRKRKYGINVLPEKNKKGFLSILFDQFQDFMIIVLMVATVL